MTQENSKVSVWQAIMILSVNYIKQALLILLAVSQTLSAGAQMYEQEKVIMDFKDVNELDSWRIINDGVMGGLSESEISHDGKNGLVFSGNLSLENNGGFASTRSIPRSYYLDGYDGILLRLKGDGKTYQFRLKTDDRFDGVSYRYEFKTEPGAWMDVEVPFNEMIPVFRGRILQGIEPVKPQTIQQLGFLISNKQAGEFNLEIEWIKSYKK